MTDEQFYVLDSLGLVVARRALAPEAVNLLNQQLDDALAGHVVAKFPLIGLGAKVTELMTHAWVMQACTRLIGDRFRFDHAFGLEQPSAQPNLHGGPQACQASCFYTAGPDGRAFSGRLSVGFALTSQSKETGGFAYIPGSHKSSSTWHGSAVLAKLLHGNFEHECIHVPTLEPGDICVFPDCLVHGTAPWKGTHTRRALYFMYSPGYMAWRPYDEIADYVALATTDLQRRLLRPPYVAHFSETGGELGGNQWREPNQ